MSAIGQQIIFPSVAAIKLKMQVQWHDRPQTIDLGVTVVKWSVEKATCTAQRNVAGRTLLPSSTSNLPQSWRFGGHCQTRTQQPASAAASSEKCSTALGKRQAVGRAEETQATQGRLGEGATPREWRSGG